MNNKILISSNVNKAIIMALFTCFYSCNLDFKQPPQVSSSIQEAKEKKVFVAEYKIANVTDLNSRHRFPIDAAWQEKAWHLDLDKSGNQITVIDEPVHFNIVFSLNNMDTLLSSKNILSKWIISGNDTLLSGLNGDMVFIPLYNYAIKDTSTFYICQMKNSNNLKNDLTKLFQFTLQYQ